MKKWVLLFACTGLAAAAYALVAQGEDQRRPASGSAIFMLTSGEESLEGFARAVLPYRWSFPYDHGPHPDFQTEWWYYTGNLATEDGRHFGYQFTVFRRAVAPSLPTSSSEWRTNQMYMAHFTVTDVSADQFYQFQRLNRGGAGLAGATVSPCFRVWLENWEVRAADEDATETRLFAAEGKVIVDLTLVQSKPPALHGLGGLSAKGDAEGNASYYYSLSRLLTSGFIEIGGMRHELTGTSWMDHEFSTSALGPDAQGWDWFGLHFNDGRDLMIGRIRLVGGGYEPAFGGLLVLADGTTRYLAADEFTLDVLDTWTSPHSGAEYPARWRATVVLDDSEEPLSFVLEPLTADQELIEGTITYWEGAVRVSGDVSGYGYAELTGYYDTMQGRF